MNLVYTVSSGINHSTFAKFAVPLMKFYATRCGAEFKFEELELKYPLFAKYRVRELLEHYERVLYIDCDILVRPDSPNLFDLVPSDRFAAFNEGSWCTDDEIAVRLDAMQNAIKQFNLEPINGFNLYRNYMNGGVFLASKEHAALFDLPQDNPYMAEITSEQNLLNYRLFNANMKTYYLPLCFNAMPWRWPSCYLEENFFIHYAGLPYDRRLMVMRGDTQWILENCQVKIG